MARASYEASSSHSGSSTANSSRPACRARSIVRAARSRARRAVSSSPRFRAWCMCSKCSRTARAYNSRGESTTSDVCPPSTQRNHGVAVKWDAGARRPTRGERATRKRRATSTRCLGATRVLVGAARTSRALKFTWRCLETDTRVRRSRGMSAATPGTYSLCAESRLCSDGS